MPSLYENGWRRGSILKANLAAAATVVEDGVVRQVSQEFGLWMVVTQDCDLVAAGDHDAEPKVELRPILNDEVPPVFGIRSRKLRVSHKHPDYIHSESLRCMISPAALSHLIIEDATAREDWLDDDELRALKTWLGLRYDRPAVPTDLVDLIVALADAIERRKNNPALAQVRDVFAQFDTAEAPPLFKLVAIVVPTAETNVVKNLLVEAALSIPLELGVMSGVDVGTPAQVSIEVLETSYAVDLTRITWRQGRPEGAA